MTRNFLLDWALMAVSLANVILLLWLGVTVLLNTERRTWGVWLVGAASLLGAAFFVSHSAILGYGLDLGGYGLNIWWRLGWLPLIALPFAWYAIMLWYAGYWDNRSPLRSDRHKGWLLLTLCLLIGLIGWLLVASPLPSFTQLAQFKLSASPAIGGIPLFLLIYPLYIVLCLGLALRALRHPAPSSRMMGDQARQRARPWLVAASAVLLLVSLLVAGVIGWALLNSRQGIVIGRYTAVSLAVAWFDLIIAGLIAIVVVLLGQAIVAYEVFTGKALPRREFKRQWHNAITLAVGYGLVVGWGFSLSARPIYSLLLTTLLMTLFYALLSWRSYTWRERYIRHLRPFVASQGLYEHLLMPTSPQDINVSAPFRALCQDVLGARLAYLLPLGSLAPLVRPLTYPETGNIPSLIKTELTTAVHRSPAMYLPLDPARAGGALWAVPLWSERGLIGVFLLGPKEDGGLYTQEEIEIARASGERLIDTRASAEIAQRLMTLQRQRLAESQVLDRQTRRVLHDDVLPQLHTVLLSLSRQVDLTDDSRQEVINLLTAAHHQISDLLRDIPKTASSNLSKRGLIGALQEIVVAELSQAFDDVSWQVSAEAEQIVKDLPALAAEVLFFAVREAMRNAARHGRAAGSSQPLHLSLKVTAQEGLTIRIEDNGVGLDTAKSPNGGSGQGLTLHSTMLAIIGGTLDVESLPDTFTRVTIRLPHAALKTLTLPS